MTTTIFWRRYGSSTATMILKSEINKYLDRYVDDHTWVKQLDHAELDAALLSLRPRMRWHPRLRQHQKACLLLGVAFPQFSYWLDMGCVDGDTEYLSPTGWVKIREYDGGEVAAYDPHSRHIKFELPRRYINLPSRKMYHFKSARGCDQLLSPEHRVLAVGGRADQSNPRFTVGALWKHTPITSFPEYKGEPWLYKASVEELVGFRGQVRFDTTFLYNGPGILLTDEQIRVQVAVHADGHLGNNTTVCIRVKKQRKKERIVTLLNSAGIPYRHGKIGGGYETFTFEPPLHTKKYGAGWWQCSFAQKRVICDEVGHWDGSYNLSGSVSFFTRSKACADFIQFCFSSTRRRAFRSCGPIDYVVHAIGNGRTTNLAHFPTRKPRIVTGNTRKYCFEVSTGCLVLRRNGNIFTTGNTGKTAIALHLLRYWHDCGLLRRAAIFLTSDKAFNTWEKQIREFDIGLNYVSLDARADASGSASDRRWRQLMDSRAPLILAPYPTLTLMNTRKIGKELAVDGRLVERFGREVDVVVPDESTFLGHRGSLRSQIGARLCRMAFARYALAGRPFGRNPEMLFTQQYMIDGGASFGTTLGMFREAFYRSSKSRFARGPRAKFVRDWKFKKKMMPDLTRLSGHRSITYSADECIDLPDCVPIVEEVTLPSEAAAYYQTVTDQLRAAGGNFREVKNAFLRMRQISSGFVGLIDDESGDRAEIEFEENVKLDRLLDLLCEIPTDCKALVFYEFNYSGARIMDELKRLEIPAIRLWSGTKDSRATLREFIEGDAAVAVVNHKVGAYSLDGLQVANYTIYYESPVGVIDRDQSERRVRRQGQKRKVFQYDLVMRGTADEKILAFHAEGRDLYDAMRHDPGALFR